MTLKFINKFFIAFLLLLISITNIKSQTDTPIPPDKPKLIIGIVVSQFRHDYIPRFWDKFTDEGFKRLIQQGTHCKNTSYDYLINDKGVGVATIVTGTNPSNHGIVADSWYNDLKKMVFPSIYDDGVKTIGGPYESGKCSPSNLLCTTFSDELNLTNKFKSKVIGISLEPASAVLSTGHTAHSAYWFDIQNGNFISSSFYLDALPSWVNEFNSKKIPDTYMESEWKTLLHVDDYTESLSDKNPYELGYRNRITFPYEVDNIAKIFGKKERYGILNTVPYGDNLVKDFAIQAIVNENLGKDEYTDVLFMNFTTLEQIGNLFGPLSVEVEDAVLRLDKELAHFLSFIDESVGIENTLLIFTAEHGIAHSPEYLSANNIPAGYFNSSSAVSLLSSYLNNIYGKGDWIKQYHAQQVYLNRSLIESAELSPKSVQEKVANLLLQFHGVQNTITAYSLNNTNYTDGVFSKIQNGYNQKRSGDIIINLKNGYIEKEGRTIASYGTDTRLPLIWYGWKIKRKSIIKPVNLIDIAPTLSVLLEISYPNSSTGIPIEEIIR